jgi:predicted nucleic acid-binding protein
VTSIFLDTSALLRRYDPTEPGAARVQAICARSSGHTLLLARLASIEMASALNRKVREGLLEPAEREHLWRVFGTHARDEYRFVAFTEPIVSQAERLVFRYPLRAYDAVHLASALSAVRNATETDFEFWTADRRQAAAARAEGLAVELVA